MTKSVFIAGANRGIGFQIVRALYNSSKESYHIFVGSRSLSPTPTRLSKLSRSSFLHPQTPIQIDIEDDTSIQSAYDTISSQLNGKLDILINAGTQFEQDLTSSKIASERELWNKSWSVIYDQHTSCNQQIHPAVFA
jgi:NAD(P)-dependent dehydrogenase (short-subunit alcohol dehydrogenase family)